MPFKLIYAVDKKDKTGTAKCSGVAYNGGKMSVSGFSYPVAVEFSGMEIPSEIPLLADHENKTDSRVGTIRARVINNELSVDGSITDSNKKAHTIIEQAKGGANWQLSITAQIFEAVFVDDGDSAIVNGRSVEGPFTHVLKSKLIEVSVVPLGADSNTSLRIAASFKNKIEPEKKGVPMKKELVEFIRAKFSLGADCDETAIKAHLASVNSSVEAMEAEFSASQKEDDQKKSDQAPASVSASAASGNPTQQADLASVVSAALDARDTAETKRQSAICTVFGDEFPEIKAKAISERWTVEKSKDELLKTIRAARPTAGSLGIIVNKTSVPAGSVIEAAAVMAGGVSPDAVEKQYTAPVVEAAMKKFPSLSLQQMILMAAWANGFEDRFINTGNWARALEAGRILNAGFSNVALPGIMSNVANKFLLGGFGMIDQSWTKVSAIGSVSDFKEITRYRLGANFKFEQVSQTGELKHGSLSETSFTNKAKTYGQIIAITRQDIINDDLGALTRIPQMMGLAAGQSFNDIFWKEFMDNSDFFKSANNNYVDGTDSVLSIAGLNKAVKAFRALKDESGIRLGMAPKFVLVPSELEATASDLYTSTTVIADGVTSTKNIIPNNNIHAHKYEPVICPYLDDADYSGYSTTAWYLLGDPAFRAVIESVFLNGVRTPKIESNETEFSTLGVQMRAYMDWGVKKQDSKAGIKSKGAAA